MRLPAPARPINPVCLACGRFLDGPHGARVVVHVGPEDAGYDLCGRCAAA